MTDAECECDHVWVFLPDLSCGEMLRFECAKCSRFGSRKGYSIRRRVHAQRDGRVLVERPIQVCSEGTTRARLEARVHAYDEQDDIFNAMYAKKHTR